MCELGKQNQIAKKSFLNSLTREKPVLDFSMEKKMIRFHFDPKREKCDSFGLLRYFLLNSNENNENLNQTKLLKECSVFMIHHDLNIARIFRLYDLKSSPVESFLILH